jgi:hypothetical protein
MGFLCFLLHSNRDSLEFRGKVARCCSTFCEREKNMAEIELTLTAEEGKFLVDHLKETLKNMRVEEHRTRTLSYRDHVLQQEAVVERLLNKLKPAEA